MTAYTVYQFDSTGFIGSIVRGNWPDDHPFLQTANFVVTTADIPATLTVTLHDGTVQTQNTVVQGGWSFVLDGNGKPTVDAQGNYVVTPPPHYVPPPDLLTHVFAGMVKAGFIDPTQVAPDLLNTVNWSLDSAKLPPVQGTALVAAPVKTAVATSNDMVMTTLGVHTLGTATIAS